MDLIDKIKMALSKKDIREYQKNLINTHYEEVENMYQDIRKWRHNYRNHLQVLRSYINEGDLAIIIGNLFDNAIEASMELPQEDRYIRLYMDMKGKKLYISMTNLTALKKQKKLGGIFKSTKGINRGLGLISVDEIVEKYGGYISRNSEDDAFTTEILI